MSLPKHCRSYELFLYEKKNILLEKILKVEGFRSLHLQHY